MGPRTEDGCNENGDKAFEHVAEECNSAQFFTQYAHGVGCANILAAMLPYIYVAQFES